MNPLQRLTAKYLERNPNRQQRELKRDKQPPRNWIWKTRDAHGVVSGLVTMAARRPLLQFFLSKSFFTVCFSSVSSFSNTLMRVSFSSTF